MIIVICFRSSFSWCLLNEQWQESQKACRPKPSEFLTNRLTIWIGLRNPQKESTHIPLSWIWDKKPTSSTFQTNSGLFIQVDYPIKISDASFSWNESIFWKMLDFFIQEIQDLYGFIPFLQQSWINPHENRYTWLLLSIYQWINPV